MWTEIKEAVAKDGIFRGSADISTLAESDVKYG